MPALSESTLRVRINQIDHTTAPPGPLDNSSLPLVPVIRIYGLSSTGKKTCLHVHQVYPYFFVEYRGEMSPESVNRYIARLSHSLNRAISISMKRNPHSPKSQFLRAILLVKGIYFYGFHSSFSPFLKIMITDPSIINRAVAIMQSGTVMQTRFRVFESHLSYTLQFLCDFGLYGCGWISLGEVWERGNQIERDDGEYDYAGHEQMQTAVFKPSPYFRQSRMPLEVDVAAHQILNRHLLTPRNIYHTLEIPAPPLPAEPLVPSVRELWDDERRRRIANGLSPSPEIPVDPSEKSRGKGGEWVAEMRWWEEIRQRIENERVKEATVIEENKTWEKWIMTTFESVEALWEQEWKKWKPGGKHFGGDLQQDGETSDAQNPFEIVASFGEWQENDVGADEAVADVDETMLSSQEMSQLVEQEETGWENVLGGNQSNDDPENEDSNFEHDDPLQFEDGLPPDLQIVEQPLTQSGGGQAMDSDTFFSASNNSPRPNLFQNAFLNLAGTHSARATSVVSEGSTTPTKPLMLLKQGSDILPVTSTEVRYQEPMQTPQVSLWSPEEISHSPQFNDVQQDGEPILDGPYSSNIYFDTTVNDTGHQVLPPQRDDAKKETMKIDVIANRPVKRRRLSLSDNSSFHSPALSLPRMNPSAVSQIVEPHLKLSSMNLFIYSPLPPSTSELLASIEDCGVQRRVYRPPFYSKEYDVPDRPQEYAGLLYHLKGGDGLSALDKWEALDGRAQDEQDRIIFNDSLAVKGWEYASSPPSVRQVKSWLLSGQGKYVAEKKPVILPSQIAGPTPNNIYGLKDSPEHPDAAIRERQHMSVFSCEIFAPSRGSRVPDPENDEIVAAFYSFKDVDNAVANKDFTCQKGVIVVASSQLYGHRPRDLRIEGVANELELLNKVVDIVLDLDPDVLIGWEVQAASWGYLNARGQHYGFDIGDLVSRAAGIDKTGGIDHWGMRHTSTFKAVGRHVLNLWRIMRAEQTLNIYTFENVVFHVLRRRIPRYNHNTLGDWYNSSVPAHASRLLRYFSDRTVMVLEMLEEAEIVTKTAEFARVFGVDFFSVISRGSQFKVESFMFRIAKPESFVLLSPSKQDVGRQNAAECMPLIMEPLSAFYSSPLVVLDFQSLYPSIMIAYNYCYSTCLGRVTVFKGKNKFGVTDLDQPHGLLEKLQDHIHVAPNGIMYVKQEVRRGLLGRMLTELLETRVMVKQAMKGVKSDKALRRILDARQLGLKYIANVTYGYTSASYSGRMPAVEIADSIVQSGRETLEKAVRVIDSTQKWGAKVVYGDTDSLFIYLKGKTKEQAFRIGYDIADAITALNPAPIKLKFEKVYLPCVLMAKKRYVGFKFESPDDDEPTFDAKGIETVRRDGVPAQRKMTENCLKILFRTQDLSQVKEYCTRSWHQVLENKVSIQDFIFAKEVKMGTYSDKAPPPPGVTVAARRTMRDSNNEPQYGERVPYVIIRGEPHTRLVDRAVEPLEVLEKRRYQLDSIYYIFRVLIPPLERIFNLVGADVRSWYDDMPRTLRADQPDASSFSPSKDKGDANLMDRFKIDEHFHSSKCIVCGMLTPEGICDGCRLQPQTTVTNLMQRIQRNESRMMNVHRICASCTSSEPAEPIRCESLDCPWFYERKKAEEKMEYPTREMLGDVEASECIV